MSEDFEGHIPSSRPKTNSLIITSLHFILTNLKNTSALLTVKETNHNKNTGAILTQNPPLLPTGSHKFSVGPKVLDAKGSFASTLLWALWPSEITLARIDSGEYSRGVVVPGFFLGVCAEFLWGEKEKGGRKSLMIWVASWDFFSDILEDFRVDICSLFNFRWITVFLSTMVMLGVHFGPLNLHLFQIGWQLMNMTSSLSNA